MKRLAEDFLWIFLILITPSFMLEKFFSPTCEKVIVKRKTN